MQPFHQWQQSPEQGMIPSVPDDSVHLSVVEENLLDALNYLQFCHTYMENTGLSKQYSEMFTAVSDSLDSCNEAISRSSDAADA